jgi:hypothetical protein
MGTLKGFPYPWLAMSNYHHTGIHDPDGNFPIFTEHFHGLLARCQNAYLGRFENFWSSEPTSVVRLVEPDDILSKMTYAFTNPAAADLVDTVEDWPGVTTFQATMSGGHITATRPKHFFRDNSGMPEVVSLKIARPHGFEPNVEDLEVLVDTHGDLSAVAIEQRRMSAARLIRKRAPCRWIMAVPERTAFP